MFCFESSQNDVPFSSFRAVNVAITVSFKLNVNVDTTIITGSRSNVKMNLKMNIYSGLDQLVGSVRD